MSSLHFVHCNFCSLQPNTGMKFYMSTCGHVSCNFCHAKNLNQPVCVKCRRKVTVQEIGPNMKGKEFFMDQAKVIDRIGNELEKMEKQRSESSAIENDELFENPYQEEEMKRLYAEADQAVAGATKAIEEMTGAYTVLERLLRSTGYRNDNNGQSHPNM